MTSEVWGVLAGAAMGLTISVLGAGGSLFIVPVLIFLFHEPVTRATGTSLAVVFAAALVGTVGHWRKGNVAPRVAVLFGVSAMAGAFLGAQLHPLASERASHLFFAIALVVAAVRMAKGNPPDVQADDAPPSVMLLIPLGICAGVMTGFLGVGGGFLIVPILVFLARMHVRQAIGTSLAVIALSSVSGAVGYALQGEVSGTLMLSIGGGAVAGAVLGAPLSGRIAERPLRLLFAAMAALLAVRFLAPL
ncbi:MAG: sulfite exporter TauE/SafE family protein [Myxococcaceae bacterium]